MRLWHVSCKHVYAHMQWVQFIYFIFSFFTDIIPWSKVKLLFDECRTIFFTTLALPMALVSMIAIHVHDKCMKSVKLYWSMNADVACISAYCWSSYVQCFFFNYTVSCCVILGCLCYWPWANLSCCQRWIHSFHLESFLAHHCCHMCPSWSGHCISSLPHHQDSPHCNLSCCNWIPNMGHLGVLCFWQVAVSLFTCSTISAWVLFCSFSVESRNVFLWEGSLLFEMAQQVAMTFNHNFLFYTKLTESMIV